MIGDFVVGEFAKRGRYAAVTQAAWEAAFMSANGIEAAIIPERTIVSPAVAEDMRAAGLWDDARYAESGYIPVDPDTHDEWRKLNLGCDC